MNVTMKYHRKLFKQNKGIKTQFRKAGKFLNMVLTASAGRGTIFSHCKEGPVPVKNCWKSF